MIWPTNITAARARVARVGSPPIHDKTLRNRMQTEKRRLDSVVAIFETDLKPDRGPLLQSSLIGERPLKNSYSEDLRLHWIPGGLSPFLV